MSYTPTEWKTGDIVTSQKLNKLENGLAAVGYGTFKVTIASTIDEPPKLTMNKTWQEIKNAFDAGLVVIGDMVTTGEGLEDHLILYMLSLSHNASDETQPYTVKMFTTDDHDASIFFIFYAVAATDYPIYEFT